MRPDFNNTLGSYQYCDELDVEDTIKKYVGIAALTAFLSAPLKIQPATYSTNQIELKVDEINKCFNVNEYINITRPQYQIDNFNCISSKIDNEFLKYSKYIDKSIVEAREQTNTVTKEIALMKFNQVSVELTPSNTIKFTLIFDDRKMLMITYPFGKMEGIPNGNVLFSFFIDRKLIVSNTSNLSDLVTGINNYLLA